MTEKIAYTQKWRVLGLCFFVQLEWTERCVSRNKGRCISIVDDMNDIYTNIAHHEWSWREKITFYMISFSVVLLLFFFDKIRRLIRLFFKKFGKAYDLLKYVPILPVDDYGLPPPWIMDRGYGNSVWGIFRAILDRKGKIITASNEIWFTFWQTLDAQQRLFYQSRWPQHTGWETFLACAAEEEVLAPQQELRWDVEVWKPLWKRVSEEEFFFEEN
ncbi:hypothetical protein AGMMS49545_23370 [Betaproteobacteria bacterium]|nr:hypothetical protein AGMMS49545_23370 [Betaproteobacteria bacterium]GHU49137.1 hypothetical protein AGMMS50289_26160 [Betaproteobacteria bacterium]